MDSNNWQFQWKNEPEDFTVQDGKITLTTKPHTDFWQRTHYGFRNDSGHCLLKTVQGDFTMEVSAQFTYQGRFDQCGVIAYHSADTWVKGSIEKENEQMGRLGSVVTNLGYSDWATMDVPATLQAVSYRLHRRGDDFLLEHAFTDQAWVQMRIFHLHHIPRKSRPAFTPAVPWIPPFPPSLPSRSSARAAGNASKQA